MKDWKNWLVLVVVIIGFALLGCRSVLDKVTPCAAPKQAMEYMDLEVPDLGFIWLSKAKEIKTDMTVKHRDTQKNHLREMQDDTYYYQVASGLFDAAISESQTVQDLAVGDEGNPMSIAGILSIGGLTYLAGALKKRKGDYTPAEHDADVSAAYEAGKNGGTT